MRIALWIFAGLLAAFLACAALPWLTMREFRESSRGREFLLIIAVLAVLLAVVLFELFR